MRQMESKIDVAWVCFPVNYNYRLVSTIKSIIGHSHFWTSQHHQWLNNWTREIFTNECRRFCYVVLCNGVLPRCAERPCNMGNSRNELEDDDVVQIMYSSSCRNECHQFHQNMHLSKKTQLYIKGRIGWTWGNEAHRKRGFVKTKYSYSPFHSAPWKALVKHWETFLD